MMDRWRDGWTDGKSDIQSWVPQLKTNNMTQDIPTVKNEKKKKEEEKGKEKKEID